MDLTMVECLQMHAFILSCQACPIVVFNRRVGLPSPQPRQVIPRIITYQRKRANRRILNEEAFIQMLKDFGELQVTPGNTVSSFGSIDPKS
jgi:hypothetical protein